MFVTAALNHHIGITWVLEVSSSLLLISSHLSSMLSFPYWFVSKLTAGSGLAAADLQAHCPTQPTQPSAKPGSWQTGCKPYARSII